jgi:uncharacterized protein
MKLAGKLSIVTGASSGIGAATARALAARGSQVILVARNASRLNAVADEIRAAGGRAETAVADLGGAAAVADLARDLHGRFGPPDLLVNNAGAGRWLSVVETSADAAAQMLAVPYLAAFNLTRELLPPMLARGSGRIVNVTSVAARLAWPGATAYIAARRAMEGFHAGLRAELRGTGVGATLAVLGTVETPYWDHNPGSRERLPPGGRGIRTLTSARAARAIVSAVEGDRPMVVKPGVFKLLFLLAALWPGLTERMIVRA